MSPEQAGSLNRAIDARSDLYSLGITLYCLAGGDLPFTADDALGWADAHMTAQRVPLEERRPDLQPLVRPHRGLPDDPLARWPLPDALGLAHDLGLALEQLDAAGRVDDFGLRQRDEAALCAAWELASGGAGEVVTIAGDAGIGKTALAHELRQAVAARGGSFIQGKFDSSDQNPCPSRRRQLR